MSVFEELLGPTLQCSNGSTVSTSERLQGRVVGLYFSAHWCPPCQQFTPVLSSLYRTLSEREEPFEVVFVSSDKNAGEFASYFGRMPWCAVPFDRRAVKDHLGARFQVRGIPTLVILDPAGEVVTVEGTRMVMQDPYGGSFPWGKLSVPTTKPAKPTIFDSGALDKIVNKLKEQVEEELGPESLDPDLLETVSKCIQENRDTSEAELQPLACLIMQLPTNKCFALLDLLRLLFLRPAAVDLFMGEYDDMLTYLLENFATSNNFFQINLLKLLCNLFSSTAGSQKFLDVHYAGAMECVAKALASDHHLVVSRGANLLENMQQRRGADGCAQEAEVLAAAGQVLSSVELSQKLPSSTLESILRSVQRMTGAQQEHRELWAALEPSVLHLLDKEDGSEELKELALAIGSPQ